MSFKILRKSQHAHVLVCRTCGDVFAGASARVRKAVEDELLSIPGESWQVRVVESSCLEVCPVGAISVRLVGAEGIDFKSLTWSIEPDADVKELIDELKKYLTRNELLRK